MMQGATSGQENPQCQNKLGIEGAGSSPSEMDLRMKDKRTIASRSMEMVLLLCSLETTLVLHPALGYSAQERGGPVGVGPEESSRNDQKPRASLL